MSKRFYLNWPLTPGPVEMTGPEARHLATVCRLRAGDEICLFNGDGHEYPARVLSTSKGIVRLEVVGVRSPGRELGYFLEIAAPLPKGDRAQFLMEKLTELGVSAYVPLLCERGVIKPREGKIDKLERYVIEASKQCGRNVLMRVEAPATWEAYCQRGEPGELRLVAHPAGKGETFSSAERILAAVGPEGGFTQEEISVAIGNSWRLVDLGPRLLRIETAAIMMAAKVAEVGRAFRAGPG